MKQSSGPPTRCPRSCFEIKAGGAAQRSGGWPLIRFRALNSSRSDGERLGGKVRNQSTAGRSKIEQLVLRVYSLMVRCKQILFKSTQRNQGRLTRGGEIRGRVAAWEPGEGAQAAGKLETQAAEKLRSLCLLHICGAASCGSRQRPRHREKGGVGVKGARGTERQVICVPVKEQGAGVNKRTQ